MSLADLVALAGARAVVVTGGPAIRVPVGRADAAGPDPEGRLPEETLPAAALLANFGAKGLGAQEMVVLLGSHTVRGGVDGGAGWWEGAGRGGVGEGRRAAGLGGGAHTPPTAPRGVLPALAAGQQGVWRPSHV